MRQSSQTEYPGAPVGWIGNKKQCDVLTWKMLEEERKPKAYVPGKIWEGSEQAGNQHCHKSTRDGLCLQAGPGPAGGGKGKGRWGRVHSLDPISGVLPAHGISGGVTPMAPKSAPVTNAAHSKPCCDPARVLLPSPSAGSSISSKKGCPLSVPGEEELSHSFVPNK